MTRDAGQGLDTVLDTTNTLEVASRAPGGKPAPSPTGPVGEIVVNVRFLPNGLVNTISYRPGHMSAQEWFDHLCRLAPQSYRPLSGGRGSFSIDPDVFAAASAVAGNGL